jgi:CheY-like chemotaxis protein
MPIPVNEAERSEACPGAAPQPEVARLSAVAHDLRTPLGGIKAMAELLAQGTLAPSQRQLVDSLLAAAHHLEAMADDLLDEEAASHHRLRVAPVPTLLPRLVEDIATSAAARAHAAGLSFRLRLGSSVPRRALLDGRRLRQAAENLIANACKVARAGRISLCLTARARADGTTLLLLSVHDEGPGVPERGTPAGQRAFATLDPALPGHGLGLFLVRGIAEALGGAFGLRNRRSGRGACAWVAIPLRPLPEEASSTPMREVAVPAVGESLLHAVVVDDNPAGARLLATVLEHFGCRCTCVGDAAAAVAAVQAGGVDLVTMDYVLPGSDGAAATRALRALPEAADTAIIAITGNTDAATRAAFREAGADAFVAKPISVAKLHEALAHLALLPRPAAAA